MAEYTDLAKETTTNALVLKENVSKNLKLENADGFLHIPLSSVCQHLHLWQISRSEVENIKNIGDLSSVFILCLFVSHKRPCSAHVG